MSADLSKYFAICSYYEGRPLLSKPNCRPSSQSVCSCWLAHSRADVRIDFLTGTVESWVSVWVPVSRPPSTTHYFPAPQWPEKVSGGKTSTSPPQSFPCLTTACSQWRRCFVLLLLWHPQFLSTENCPATGPSYSGHILSHGSNFLPVRQQSGELK